MTEPKLQQHISEWLTKNHAPDTHVTILNNVMAVGKPSKRWVETIQRYVQNAAFQTPDRGEIKRACRALLDRRNEHESASGDPL